jgi:hypothetical protein
VRIGSTSDHVPEARSLLLRYFTTKCVTFSLMGLLRSVLDIACAARRITIRALPSDRLIYRRHRRGLNVQNVGGTAATFDDPAEHWRNTAEFPVCSPLCADER